MQSNAIPRFLRTYQYSDQRGVSTGSFGIRSAPKSRLAQIISSLTASALIFSLCISPLSAQTTAPVQSVETAAQPDEVKTEAENLARFDFFDNKLPASLDQLREMQNHFRDLAKKVHDATVNIQVGQAQGSGVIVTRDGYIMTAAHVIGGSDLDAIITLPDGTKLEGKTLGLNRTIDSGMAKITSDGKFDYLEIGESGLLKAGQWVMSIGHPGGFDPDRGLVFRVGRVLRHDENVITTDCTLVGGDSGGPLVDMDGSVIGIHSRIGVTLFNNFHVPADTFTETWDDLTSSRDWGRGIGGSNPENEPWLGFSLAESSLVIDAITKRGPADKAGLKSGDELVEMAGRPLNTPTSLRLALENLKPGDTVDIKIIRDEKELQIELTVGSGKDRR